MSNAQAERELKEMEQGQAFNDQVLRDQEGEQAHSGLVADEERRLKKDIIQGTAEKAIDQMADQVLEQAKDAEWVGYVIKHRPCVVLDACPKCKKDRTYFDPKVVAMARAGEVIPYTCSCGTRVVGDKRRVT